MKKQSLLVLFYLLSLVCIQAQVNRFYIDVSRVSGVNTEFWKASGTDLLYHLAEKESGQALLNRMEKTNSCIYLRNHYTLGQHIREGIEVGIDIYSEDENGNPVYDFSRLNRIYGEFVKRGLKPVVECDYIPVELLDEAPTGTVSNDEDIGVKNSGPEDWDKWRNLLVAFTKNLIETFGEEEVRTWYFEVWNEPDGWEQSEISTFYKLYDVFVDAVTSVDSQLKVGGPACYHEWFLKEFLDHVVYGNNHVTGKKGTRIDFISYHIYGLSGSWLNGEPVVRPQVQRFSQSVLWISRLLKKYPELKDVAFHLNEWGMSSHFQKTVTDYPDLEYRNSEESALFLVKLVDCLYAIEDNYNFPTSMLLYWGGAWEAEKNEFFKGHRTLTTAGNIPKPIQTGFELLAHLGDHRLEVDGPRTGGRLGVMATKSPGDEIQMIVYNYNETDDDPAMTDQVELQITGLSDGLYDGEIYSLDSENNNTYREWIRQGSPITPDDADMLSMNMMATLSSTSMSNLSCKNGIMKLYQSLPKHSLKLVLLKPAN